MPVIYFVFCCAGAARARVCAVNAHEKHRVDEHNANARARAHTHTCNTHQTFGALVRARPTELCNNHRRETRVSGGLRIWASRRILHASHGSSKMCCAHNSCTYTRVYVLCGRRNVRRGWRVVYVSMHTHPLSCLLAWLVISLRQANNG